MLIPLIGAQGASAAAAKTTHTPACIVLSTPSQVESGYGSTTSSIADFIGVACHPAYSEQTVEISSPQLNELCHGTLSWASTTGTGTGETFDVVLDDDGNAGAVVWGGPSCAAGKALITADLTVAPFTTAKTHFTILPPTSTKPGITAVPSALPEDSTYSSVATVFNIEFPSVYSEDQVEVSSPQLYDRCHGNIEWVGADEVVLASGTKSVDVSLDNDGNAFVVALAGPSCATGKSLVTADLLAPPGTTKSTTFTILEPTPVNP